MAFATNPEDRTRVHYEVEGNGRPLVLAHGSATSSALCGNLDTSTL